MCIIITKPLIYSTRFLCEEGAGDLELAEAAPCWCWWITWSVYDQKGHLLWPIGKNLFGDASDVATTCDGRVAIVDGEDSCIYIFNVEGMQVAKFKMSEGVRYYRMACHPLGDYVAIAGLERKTHRLILTLYTLKKELVSNIQMQEKNIYSIAGITVTVKGYIAVALRGDTTSKVIVVYN